MASQRLKTVTRTAYGRHFYNQPFQSFTDIRPLKYRQCLLFRSSAATSAPHFPTKHAATCERARADSGSNRRGFEASMNGRQFIYHMQGL
ncbi:MAG: hypothetical protein WA669_12650, partial [Pseudolabrys sp.]